MVCSGFELAEQTCNKADRRINLELSKAVTEVVSPRDNFGFQEDNKLENLNFNMLNLNAKFNENISRSSLMNGMHNMNAVYQNPNISSRGNFTGSKYGDIKIMKDPINQNNSLNNNKEDSTNSATDKRFKTLPAAEMLPRNEVLGRCIFVCNNDTMQEDLKRQLFGNYIIRICSWSLVVNYSILSVMFDVQIFCCMLFYTCSTTWVLFGLPPRYRDSVRAITPGLPLFLYNYTTHQMHGIFGVTSFGGSNIDPTAWEDKKCKGELRFPAQVRIRVRKICKPLEEDAFRPVLHHYDGPKFRLELSVLGTLDLLDLCEQASI